MADNVLVQASKPGGLNLTSTVNNTAADGYASFFVSATENDVGQIYVGNGSGLNIGSKQLTLLGYLPTDSQLQ